MNLAFCMLDSLSHVHTETDMVQHLHAVLRATSDKAMYIVELGLLDN